ncbi:MAG: tetratricopeptide repeat protein [Bacteroidota bacterium]
MDQILVMRVSSVLPVFLLFVILSSAVMAQRTSEEAVGQEGLFIIANQYKLLGKYDKAVDAYQRIIKSDPLNAAAYHDLARVYLSLSKLEDALGVAKKAVNYAPDNTWYQMTLASLYEEDQDFTPAAEIYQNLAVKKDNPDLYMRWAISAEKSGNPANAISAYRAADQRWGRSEARSDAIIDLYLDQQDTKKAIREIQGWIERSPNEPRYQVKLADFYAFIGEERKARKAYEGVLKEFPNNQDARVALQSYASSIGSAKSNINALINDGSVGIAAKVQALSNVMSRSTEADAEKLFSLGTSLIQQYPQDFRTQAIYGDINFLIGDLAEAINGYQASLDLEKSNYAVWEQYMRCLWLNESMDQLADVSAEALDYYPNQAGPYYYQALVSYGAGDANEAQEYAEEAIVIGVDSPMSEQAHILKGRIMADAGNIPGAIEYIEEIQSGILRPPGLEFLGDLYLMDGQGSKAKSTYQQAIKKGGDPERIKAKIAEI